jgi:hypothetical protein
MSALERLLAGMILVLALLLGGAWWVRHYGAERYEAGQAAAVEAGEKLRQAEADRNRKTETDLRAQLAAADTDAYQKDQQHAQDLEAAQRRVRTGVDSLRCPAAGPVQPAAAPGDRPTAAGAAPDGQGAELVPDAAAEILGDGATIAGLVRKYDRLNERFEACRAVNAVP